MDSGCVKQALYLEFSLEVKRPKMRYYLHLVFRIFLTLFQTGIFRLSCYLCSKRGPRGIVSIINQMQTDPFVKKF
jgi:hypothetical protein